MVDKITSRPIVTLENVAKHYTEAGKKRFILNGVNATFYEGEFAVLLGPSGSGKSTVLNLISGVDEVDGGRIRICDTVLTDLQEPALTLFRRDNIGIVFQFFNLIPTLTVLENVILPYELQGHSHKDAKAHGMTVLEEVELADRVFRIEDGQLVEDTQRLREGARLRAELAAQMDDAVAMQMAQFES